MEDATWNDVPSTSSCNVKEEHSFKLTIECGPSVMGNLAKEEWIEDVIKIEPEEDDVTEEDDPLGCHIKDEPDPTETGSHRDAKTKKKTSVEKRKLQKRIAERKRYDKLKSDPAQAEELRRKEKLKRQKKKENGKIKLIADMTSREKRTQREKWKKSALKCRLKKMLGTDPELNGPHLLDTPGPSNPPTPSPSSLSLANRRKSIYTQLRLENRKMKAENDSLKRTVESLQKALLREKFNGQRKMFTDIPSPKQTSNQNF